MDLRGLGTSSAKRPIALRKSLITFQGSTKLVRCRSHPALGVNPNVVNQPRWLVPFPGSEPKRAGCPGVRTRRLWTDFVREYFSLAA